MFVATLILILSVALFLYYLQSACQRVLRREFLRAFSQAIVEVNRLEFPSVRKSIQEFDLPLDYPRITLTLKCDFLALRYLLENAANVKQHYTYEERLLVIYFKVMFMSLAMRHWLRLREQPAVLKLTAILEYFANVVGERVDRVRFGNLAASDYLLNL